MRSSDIIKIAGEEQMARTGADVDSATWRGLALRGLWLSYHRLSVNAPGGRQPYCFRLRAGTLARSSISERYLKLKWPISITFSCQFKLW